MAIYLGDVEYSGVYLGVIDISGVVAAGSDYVEQGDSYSIDRTLDRSFGTTPASGGGNVEPDTFTYDGDTWQLWQVVPFIGSNVGSNVGDCRIQLRDTSIGRGQNLLVNMPDRIRISKRDSDATDPFIGLPWNFTRPTSNSKFSSPGSGNNARRAIDYEPIHTPASSPANAGIAQGESFTITLFFD